MQKMPRDNKLRDMEASKSGSNPFFGKNNESKNSNNQINLYILNLVYYKKYQQRNQTEIQLVQNQIFY